MNAPDFQKALISHEKSLLGFAYRFTSNHEDAKDLLQETFLKALKYKDKFAESTNLKAWLYTIMKNTFINNYRKASRANTIVDETEENYFINQTNAVKVERPDQSVGFKEISQMINALDDDYRVPFQMHYNGFKYKEIAEQLELPIGTIKSRIFLARQKLSTKLKGYR